MKKLLFVFGLATLAFVGCKNEVENHQTWLVRPSSGTSVMTYADQKLDSICFMTTESYTLTSSVDWCKIPEGFKSLKNPYTNTLVISSVPVQLEANTTGEGRMALINIAAGENTITATVYQYPFLCITYPVRGLMDGVLSELLVPSKTLTAEVNFTTFDSWTLVPKDGTWLHVDTKGQSGSEGEHKVSLTLDANDSGEIRRDTLLLTSRGVTDKIPVAQEP